MSKLLALDVAMLPPPDIRRRAIQLSASLPRRESRGLLLDDERPPHVTLTQQFVRVDALDEVVHALDAALRAQAPVTLHVTGGGRSGGGTVWMAVERTPPLVRLHERLMGALRAFERPAGGADAFFEENGRAADVAWVAGYRLKASLTAYTPHITLGHASTPPALDPFTFEATAIAACHLGRFCTCRRVLRQWELSAADDRSHTA